MELSRPGWQFNLMISKVFSNVNDSLILLYDFCMLEPYPIYYLHSL